MMMTTYKERKAFEPIMHAHDNLEGIGGGSQNSIPR